MSDWSNWNSGTKSYGAFVDKFLESAGADREMDGNDFKNFMSKIGVQDGKFEAVAQSDGNKTISLSEMVARMNVVDLRDQGDKDGLFSRSEMNDFFKVDADSKGGGTGGSVKFSDVNKDTSGLPSMMISKDELKNFLLSDEFAGCDGKLNGTELKAAAKAMGADAERLAGYAGTDGYLDGAEIDKAFSAADMAEGNDDDGQLNADEFYKVLGANPNGSTGPGTTQGFGFGSVDKNGDKAVTPGEIYDSFKALSDPGNDGKWQGNEVEALAKAAGIPVDVLTKMAGSDGYLDKSDIEAAVKANDADGSGSLSESEFSKIFGSGGTGGETKATLKFEDINKDTSGLPAMMASKDEILNAMTATKTDGGDGTWQGDEVKALADKLGVSADALTKMAGTDGYLDTDDVTKAISAADKASGNDDDGQLNADELYSFFGVSAPGGSSGGVPESIAFGTVDKNGDKAVTTDEIFERFSTLSAPGSDAKWQGNEVDALAKASGVPVESLTKMAGSDGYLDKADIGKAVQANDADGNGSLNETEYTAMFGNAGTGNGGSNGNGGTNANTGPDFSAFNKDQTGTAAMFATTGEIFDFLIQSNTHGGDYIWQGDQEINALASALKVDASVLKDASVNGTLDASAVAALVAGADGENSDNQIDADQMKAMLKVS